MKRPPRDPDPPLTGPILDLDCIIDPALCPKPPKPPKPATDLPQTIGTADIALGCSPDNIWVIFNAIPPGSYVQGPRPASAPEATSHPPCVIVRAQAGRTAPEREALVAAVAAAGRGLSIPADNVWIYYDEMRSADAWFGGRWAG